MSDTEGTVTILEIIPDKMVTGKVKESMDNGTYFKDSMERIKALEDALIWCSSAKSFRKESENAYINTIQPLLKDKWF